MHIHTHALLAPTPGTQRELQSLHYGQAGTGPKVYIQASLHADELPGMLVAWHLRQQLDALERAGRIQGEIVLVPMANPIGLSQWLLQAPQGRFEQLSGENFNRHYPDVAHLAAQAAEGKLTQDLAHNTQVLRSELLKAVQAQPIETGLQSLRGTLMVLACDADVVLDLHCDAQAVLRLYTETPCWEQCEPLARYLGARVTLLATDSGDNPFDEACSQVWRRFGAHFAGRHPVAQACLAVTVELRGYADVSHEQAALDAQNILSFLTHRGCISGSPPPLPEAVGDARPLAGSIPVKAPCGGLLVFLHEAGTMLSEGQVLAHVIDPLSGHCTELLSPVAGLLFARDNLRFVTAGARIAKVAGLHATRTGKLLGA